jgi:hypothetical protein
MGVSVSALLESDFAFFVLRASTRPQTGDMHDSDDINPHVDWDDDDDVQEERSPPSQPQIAPADADDEISLLDDDDNQDTSREAPQDARETLSDAHTTAGTQELPVGGPFRTQRQCCALHTTFV